MVGGWARGGRLVGRTVTGGYLGGGAGSSMNREQDVPLRLKKVEEWGGA